MACVRSNGEWCEARIQELESAVGNATSIMRSYADQLRAIADLIDNSTRDASADADSGEAASTLNRGNENV
jgi:hypothetical protein